MSKQQIYQSETGTKQIQSIKQTYQNILAEFDKVQKHSKRSKGKKSKRYIDLFEKMLTMMKDQYNVSNNKYYTVDIQQEVDIKCLNLTQQLALHRKQCNAIQQKLVEKKKQLIKEKTLQRQLENEKRILQQGSKNKQQELSSLKQYVRHFRNKSSYQQKPGFKLELIEKKRNNSLSIVNPQSLNNTLPKWTQHNFHKNSTDNSMKKHKHIDSSTMNSFLFLQNSPRI